MSDARTAARDYPEHWRDIEARRRRTDVTDLAATLSVDDRAYIAQLIEAFAPEDPALLDRFYAYAAHIDALTAKVEALPYYDGGADEDQGIVSRGAVLAILRGEA